jgi:hypothetical protein
MDDEIVRVDRYTISVNGKRIRATERQEQIIRAMDPEARARFLAVMGVK